MVRRFNENHSICFRGEIKKNISLGYSLLPDSMENKKNPLRLAKSGLNSGVVFVLSGHKKRNITECLPQVYIWIIRRVKVGRDKCCSIVSVTSSCRCACRRC